MTTIETMGVSVMAREECEDITTLRNRGLTFNVYMIKGERKHWKRLSMGPRKRKTVRGWWYGNPSWAGNTSGRVQWSPMST